MMTQPSLNSLHVVIIGMGLMGASLGYDLRGHVRRVTGVVRRPEAVDEVMASGCADDAVTDARAAVAEADLVVLATPVRTILRQIEELGPLMKPGTVLIDMASPAFFSFALHPADMFGRTNLSLPPNSGFAGKSFVAQGFGLTPAGLAFSNGLDLRL